MFPDDPQEMSMIRSVRKQADVWGYGNIIHRLKYAWFLKLVEDGLHPVASARHAGLDKDEVKKISKLKDDKLQTFLDGVKKYIGD